MSTEWYTLMWKMCLFLKGRREKKVCRANVTFSERPRDRGAQRDVGHMLFVSSRCPITSFSFSISPLSDPCRKWDTTPCPFALIQQEASLCSRPCQHPQHPPPQPHLFYMDQTPYCAVSGRWRTTYHKPRLIAHKKKKILRYF